VNEPTPDPGIFDSEEPVMSSTDSKERTHDLSALGGPLNAAAPAPPPPPPPGKRPARQRPSEPPAPRPAFAGGSKAIKRRGGKEPTSNLEMVEELLRKVREAEEKLRAKESTVARLEEEARSVARKLKVLEAPFQSDERDASVHLESLLSEVFPSEPTGVAKGADWEGFQKSGRDSRAEPTGPEAAAGGQAQVCPVCLRKLEKAKCLEIMAAVCLHCRSIFLDYSSVRQLARTHHWFKSVEGFLNSAPRQKSTSR